MFQNRFLGLVRPFFSRILHRVDLPHSLFALLILLCVYPQNSFGFGLFLTQEGPLRGGQGRTLLVRTGTGYEFITQGNLSTYFEESWERKPIYWLLPVFNIENLDSNPPQAQVISSAILDELSTLTAPQLQGACNEMPNGEESIESLPMKSGEVQGGEVRFFNALKLQAPLENPNRPSDFERYIELEGLQIPSDLQESFSWMLDQNLMLIVVKFEAGLIDGEVDPTLSISLPLNPVPSYQIAPHFTRWGLMGNPSDLVFWILDQDRFRILPTRELDFTDVSFVNETQTDYLQWFDALVQTQQTQIVVVESISNVSSTTFNDPLLAQIRNENNADKLTRLRARMSSSVLDNNGRVLEIRTQNRGNYDRGHRVQGSMCAPEADMEIEVDLGEMNDLQVEDQMMSDMMIEVDQEVSMPDQGSQEPEVDAMMAEEEVPASSEGCMQSQTSTPLLGLWGLMMLWGGRRLRSKVEA